MHQPGRAVRRIVSHRRHIGSDPPFERGQRRWRTFHHLVQPQSLHHELRVQAAQLSELRRLAQAGSLPVVGLAQHPARLRPADGRDPGHYSFTPLSRNSLVTRSDGCKPDLAGFPRVAKTATTSAISDCTRALSNEPYTPSVPLPTMPRSTIFLTASAAPAALIWVPPRICEVKLTSTPLIGPGFLM